MKQNVLDAPIREIRWLGRFIHPLGRREKFTIVLKSYLDASGKNTDPVAVVAGFVTNEDGWAIFEKKWQAFLDEFEINLIFNS